MVKNELDIVRDDADELIQEVIKKIPKERKSELLAFVKGFAIAVEDEKKAG